MLKAWSKRIFSQARLAREHQRYKKYYDAIHEQGKIMFAGRLLARAAHLFPQTYALICQDRSITYKDLYKKTVAVSTSLIKKGIKPGDHVALLFENSIEFYIGYYGAWQTGAVIIPLNTLLHEKELVDILSSAKPQALIVSQEFQEQLKQYSSLDIPIIFSQDEIEKADASEREIAEYKVPSRDPDEMAALLYTSGTTGAPKGVMLSSRNILTNVVQGVAHINVSDKDRVLASLPLFHSFAQFACVWGSIFVGGTVIVVPRIERRLLLEGIEKKPTLILGVPALYGLFCLMKNVSFTSVRYFASGGDALPDKIRMGFELIYRRRLSCGYGLTETSPVISASFDDSILATNTVGRPVIGLSCSLRDEEGKEVPQGEKGILWVKGDNVMLGYYKQPELTAEVMQDGWFDTGDWAYMDHEGRLIISGRHKDLIIHKGINIYPQEIENILLSHQDIVQAGVVGKKDNAVGEIPVAFIVLSSSNPDIEQELKNLCKQHLAAYKIPRQIHVLSAHEMPLTPLKKVDKKKLRAEYLNKDEQ